MKPPLQILVTAGSTHSPIDDVRYWTNIFTGNTGLQIALAMRPLGQVTLLTSNLDHAAKFGPSGSQHDPRLTIATFVTFAELAAALAAAMLHDHFAAVFMTAAVSDYQPAGAYAIESVRPIPQSNPPRWEWIVQDIQKPKVAGDHPHVAFTGVRTAKLVDKFRSEWNYRGLLCKFKLEAGLSEAALLAKAAASRVHSGADIIVANTLEMVQGTNPAAYIIDAAGAVRVPRAELPQRLSDCVSASPHAAG